MWNILRLIRIRTLVFATLTMYLMRYFVVKPILDINGFTLQMTDWAFSLVVISVCCLISAAYIINDYFDTKSDRISGVKDIVVGKTISRRIAIALHSVLNVIAVGIAFYLAFEVGVWKIGILFLLISGILWFYSSSYKRYFILGNLIVGILASFIPFAAIVYEIPLLNMAYAEILLETDTNFVYIFNWILGFAWFIFLNTVMYEINKDIYSVDGDRENVNDTIPVKMGIQTAKNIITTLVIIAMLSSIALYCFVFLSYSFILYYIVLAILIPYIIYIISIQNKKYTRKFQLRLIKLIMLLCVSGSFLLKYFFQLIFVD